MILLVLITGIVSGAVGFGIKLFLDQRSQIASRNAANQQINMAQERSQEILLEAKESSLQLRLESEKEINEEKRKIRQDQSKIDSLKEKVEKQISELDQEKLSISEQVKFVEQQQKDLSNSRELYAKKIEDASEISYEDAKNILLKEAQEDIEHKVAKKFRAAEEELELKVEDHAKNIIAGAVQRFASDVVAEETIQAVSIPSEDMKGRLIGRDGRNIRAIEKATGVDLIVDESPESVTVSCFDPIRRQVAINALNELIKDGRIHPARIESISEKSRKDINKTIRKAGEDATFESYVKGLHPEIVNMMGRLKYRYSYGENVLQHSIEVAHLGALMANEIGADEKICRTGGFLHDIGKALTHEVDGPHAEIGADLVNKYEMDPKIVTVIREHHDSDFSMTESFIVAAADALSASRPGARRDSAEAYIKRLKDIEEIALSFEGVEKCFAIEAGRELRVMVDPIRVNDDESALLAKNIVEKIESSLNYPGQIKVIVIRESRSTEIAQ
ncbi:MAG: ribonuclease Y [Dehalococcoidia bacterium]|nr:ribonuclease Y [Dehalococcoidia bacterium]MQG04371.1 ribonuclease Y [SAR202 cluster bacterium]|tara:strand:+ start:128 stop:1639 length:1512 start_codon:yes stop_codon:yes gene_type:complete